MLCGEEDGVVVGSGRSALNGLATRALPVAKILVPRSWGTVKNLRGARDLRQHPHPNAFLWRGRTSRGIALTSQGLQTAYGGMLRASRGSIVEEDEGSVGPPRMTHMKPQ